MRIAVHLCSTAMSIVCLLRLRGMPDDFVFILFGLYLLKVQEKFGALPIDAELT